MAYLITDVQITAGRIMQIATSSNPPFWVHVDYVREKYRFSYGETLIAALSSNWARLDDQSGSLGVVVSDRGQFPILKRWTMQLARNHYVPADCEDAETTAFWHTLSLSDMVEACGRDWAPEIAAFASRKVWFKNVDIHGWQPPHFVVAQVSDYAVRDSDLAR